MGFLDIQVPSREKFDITRKLLGAEKGDLATDCAWHLPLSKILRYFYGNEMFGKWLLACVE